MLLPAFITLLTAAPDVYKLSDFVYYRDAVPPTLGVVVNSDLDRDLFAAGAVAFLGNTYLGVSVASSMRVSKLTPILGDQRKSLLRYWYGLWLGYIPGQLELRLDRTWSFVPVAAVGAGVETSVPIYENRQESSDPGIEPVVLDYQASAYSQQRGRYLGLLGLLASCRGIGVYGSYNTRNTVDIGFAFDVGKF